jgi:pilus assembly protein Flp/PilA
MAREAGSELTATFKYWREIMNALTQGLGRFVRDEEGATMVEYGLMLALIAVVCITAVGVIGTNLNLVFEGIGAALAPLVP